MQWKGPVGTRNNRASLLLRRLEKMDWVKVVEDVRPLLNRHPILHCCRLYCFCVVIVYNREYKSGL